MLSSFRKRRNHCRKCSLCGRTRGRILSPQELLRLGRPWHQLAVQAYPIGLQIRPEIRGRKGSAHTLQHLGLELRIVEEPPAGARIADSRLAFAYAEAPKRRLGVAANHNHSPRAHVLLFTY